MKESVETTGIAREYRAIRTPLAGQAGRCGTVDRLIRCARHGSQVQTAVDAKKANAVLTALNFLVPIMASSG